MTTKDYYPVLARATSALDPNTEETRQAVYDRARLAIMDAGLPAAETNAERSALEDAIRRVETRLQHAAGAPAAAARVTPRRPGASLVWPAALGLCALVGLVLAVSYWPRGGSVSKRDAIPTRAPPAAAITVPASTTGAGDAAYLFKRQLVYYRSIHPPGTIVVAKSQRYLYLVRPNLVAMRYTVGVGPECANAVGLLTVSAKDDWGDTGAAASDPPARVAAAAPAAGRFGPRSLTLGDTAHRIFGAAPPIAAVRDGCFALVNEDVIDLYERVSVGTRVVIN